MWSDAALPISYICDPKVHYTGENFSELKEKNRELDAVNESTLVALIINVIDQSDHSNKKLYPQVRYIEAQ